MAVKCGRCRCPIRPDEPQHAAVNTETQEEIVVCGHCARMIAKFALRTEG